MKQSTDPGSRLRRIAMALCLGLVAVTAQAGAATLSRTQVKVDHDTTQVHFTLSSMPAYRYFSLDDPGRAVIDFPQTTIAGADADIHGGAVRGLRLAHHADGSLRAVIDLESGAHLAGVSAQGHTLIARIEGAGTGAGTPGIDGLSDRAPAAAPRPTSASHDDAPKALYKATRATGPVVVVIDPGHGGHDSGTRAANGLMEKTVVLGIAKDLYAKLKATASVHPVLTRDSDRFISLRERVKIAQAHHANLFVSIHANAFPDDHSVDGATCYMLSEHGATDAKAAQVAHFENTRDRSLSGVEFSGDPTLNAVLTDLFQNAAINDANDVAGDIIHEFARVGPIYRRTPPRANFAVLRDPMIPSVLCETAFLSNPHQARLMGTARFREQLANAMFKGIMRYFREHPAEQMKATAGTLYTVRSGDTLSELAQRQGVSENAIMDINHLHSHTLRAGQKLQLPHGG